MPPRGPSPFDPSRKALVEPIQQPLYSSQVLTAAAPEVRISFFPVPAASQGNPVFANVNDNKLANPKIFAVRGFRIHVAQSSGVAVTVVDAGVLNNLLGLTQIAESYWYRFFIGVKEYLRAPVFWMSSGVGIWATMAQEGATADPGRSAYTQTLGQPHRENYFKIHRRPIVIPPQQEFEADLNLSPAGLAAFAITGGTTRRVWNFLEGELGREVM